MFTAELDVAAMQNVDASAGVVVLGVPVRVSALVMLKLASVCPEQGRITGAPWQLPAPDGQSASDKHPRNFWIEQN